MEDPHRARNNGEVADHGHGLQIVNYSPFNPCTKLLSPCFDLRVFYVRISGLQVDESTPEFLTLNHIPLSPDTQLEINGVRSSTYFDGVSSVLRRDRVDKKSEEATFVNTDNLRLTGSTKFEVYDKEQCILSGILQMSDSNGFTGESRSNAKRWSMSCETEVTACSGFLRGKHVAGPELPNPTIEVYVAGCYSGTPIILTKSLQLNFRKKHNRKYTLDAIPEYETTEVQKHGSDGLDFQKSNFIRFQLRVWKYMLFAVRTLLKIRVLDQELKAVPSLVADYRNFKPDSEEDYHSMYWQRTGYVDGEDGELSSWFNAGVRVGVGIGLGMCVGIGIGVGLLVRTYKATTHNFKRRL